MKKIASQAQMADVVAILARHPWGHAIAQAVIEREERVLVQSVIQPAITLHGITPPPGGRIHLVWVFVDESRPWRDAASAGCPHTASTSDIWQLEVSNQYPSRKLRGVRPILLANFGKNTMGDDNIAWGKSQKLRPESPRAVFAIAENNPTLDEILGMKGCMGIVSLKECSFGGFRRAPDAWWGGTERKAGLGYFDGVWLGGDWFAFSREELVFGVSGPEV